MLFDAGAADPEVAPDALDLDPVAEDDDREKRFDSDSSGDDANDPANVYVRCAHGTARPFVPQGSTRAARPRAERVRESRAEGGRRRTWR